MLAGMGPLRTPGKIPITHPLPYRSHKLLELLSTVFTTHCFFSASFSSGRGEVVRARLVSGSSSEDSSREMIKRQPSNKRISIDLSLKEGYSRHRLRSHCRRVCVQVT